MSEFPDHMIKLEITEVGINKQFNLLEKNSPALLLKYRENHIAVKSALSPDQCGSGGWASSCKAKGHWFESLSGHMLRFGFGAFMGRK